MSEAVDHINHNNEQIESLALKLSLVTGFISGAGMWLYAGSSSVVSLEGPFSIVWPILFISGGWGFALFQVGYHLDAPGKQLGRASGWRSRLHSLSLSLAYTLFYLGLAWLVVLFVQSAFTGLALDSLTASLLMGILGAVVGYSIISLSASINSMAIIHTLLLFVLIGVSSSMIFNNDPFWWQKNFSYLGEIQSNTFWVFNITLILAGLLLLALSDFLFYELQSAIPGRTGGVRNYRVLHGFFIFIAICLSMVGLFPNVEGTLLNQIHTWAANLLVAAFMVVILFIRRLLPGVPSTFYVVSYLFVIVLAVMYFGLFQYFGYFSLTAFEMTAFGICFVWLYLLLKTIAARQLDHRQEGVLAMETKSEEAHVGD